MKGSILGLSLFLAFLAAGPSWAGDCSPNAAEELSTKIQTELTLAQTGGLDASQQDKLRSLQQDFSEAGESHTKALDSDDQVGLNGACDGYRHILEEVQAITG